MPAGRLRAGSTDAFHLPEDRRRSLLAALVEVERNYDPSEQMLAKWFRSRGYNTTLSGGRVHPTHESLTYAAALLDSGQPEYLRRAEDILRKVIPLQDQDLRRRTYGIWPWFLEEPLEQMSPPDWNWADFCGVQLLAAWIGHRDRLAPDVCLLVRDSIRHAACSVQNRNVGVYYTNIAIMGTYVTLVAAEQLRIPGMQEYSRDRLRRLHAYIMDQGSFTEYNSPIYSILALAELSRMLLHVANVEDRRLIWQLHDLAWRHVATHFHAPTRQWAGPNSRSYRDDLRRSRALAFLEAATQGGAGLLKGNTIPLGLDFYRLPLRCPPDLVSYFRELKAPREVIEEFIKPTSAGYVPKNAVIGTTWLHPQFALGSVNRGDLWKQRRPLLAHWGTREKTTYLRVRFLHDGADFCSALVFSAQHEGRVLSSVVLACNGGDTHPLHDRVKNATIQAEDLRLRFEVGAELAGLRIDVPGDPTREIVLTQDAMEIGLYRLGDSFDGQRAQWEQGGDETVTWIDAVLYSGPRKALDLSKLADAFVAFALDFRTGCATSIEEPPRLVLAKGLARTSWDFNMGNLKLDVPVKPLGWFNAAGYLS